MEGISPVTIRLFKWEDSPGLYHGCAVCGTSLNNPKAKKTCYGTHSEPCIKYHQTMFHIGESHKCDAHRYIAKCIQELHELDQENDLFHQNLGASGLSKIGISDKSTPFPKSGTKTPAVKVSSDFRTPSKSSASRRGSSVQHLRKLIVDHRSKSVHKNARAIPPKAVRWMDNPVFGTAEEDKYARTQKPRANSQKLTPAAEMRKDMIHQLMESPRLSNHLNTQTSKSWKQTPAKLRREEKKTMKYLRLTSKALRRQSMTCSSTITTNELVEKVSHTIHGPTKALSSMSPEAISQVSVEHITRHEELQKKVAHIKSSHDLKFEDKDGLLVAASLKIPYIRDILDKLSVKPPSPKDSRRRRTLMCSLIEAILGDFEFLANEARETLKRAAGYWRFANKRTYLAMTQNNKTINWETGEKINEEAFDSSEQE
ncbi:hypothetical protein CPC735_059040 [Coccidioides posadasii C735 delta SOWgp]|uniref:Uncharacterized protein n=1 Tax=Coccidioides posadasii (strain C735) TaxID=222929 RepID=C5PEL4_COCP7|nr:hypothetical protein CPC735_059040 [Coccidioides posadasii C735 delta SOWgp]EER24534.1 hypothetical protein CPC735_059040 [Coccidioides posadasii C735 delta SOWgp]|eukprot:XP_003066679.1 hypothetical protein CPC735_059040 [Coccidioides posadasii C735 delta SOWgp]